MATYLFAAARRQKVQSQLRKRLGASEGEFANTNFSSNLGDVVAAADHLREQGPVHLNTELRRDVRHGREDQPVAGRDVVHLRRLVERSTKSMAQLERTFKHHRSANGSG